MAAKSTNTTTAALADAFAALSVEGKAVTVRALREHAKISTNTTSAWLRANRPSRDVPPVPADALERVLEPLWSAAMTAARDEHAESDATERAALIQAETDALAELAAATSRAEDAEDEVSQLRREVANLTARLDAAEAARDQQVKIAAAANSDAIDARATARTLRDVIDRIGNGVVGDGGKL